MCCGRQDLSLYAMSAQYRAKQSRLTCRPRCELFVDVEVQIQEMVKETKGDSRKEG